MKRYGKTGTAPSWSGRPANKIMSPSRIIDFPLYLITDRRVLPPGRTLLEAVEGALAGGIRAVQLREKDLSVAELYPLAQEMRDLTRRYRARLLINDRLDLAQAVQADGVHLGGHSLPTAVARQILGNSFLIGVSTHDPAEISLHANAEADFVTFGPVYATPSKLAFGDPVGESQLATACDESPLPVFALGGVRRERLAAIKSCGAHGAAMIAAVLAADDPSRAATELLAAWS